MKFDKANLSFELRNGFPFVMAEPKEFGVLAMFLSIWNNSREIKNELIPYIDERIIGLLNLPSYFTLSKY